MSDTHCCGDCSGDITLALFNNGAEMLLIRLEHNDADHATADAAARGYTYVGCYAITGGKPSVVIEPGYESVVYFAGVVFAAFLGTHHLKQATISQRTAE